MWKDSIKIIKTKREKQNRFLNTGCTNDQLSLFQEEVKKQFGHVLPKEYIDFLLEINGVEFNGLIFYGTDRAIFTVDQNQSIIGYIEANIIWHENEEQKKYMFFGDSSISWYCYNITRKQYVQLDKPSGEVEKTFGNFDDMLDYALDTHLN